MVAFQYTSSSYEKWKQLFIAIQIVTGYVTVFFFYMIPWVDGHKSYFTFKLVSKYKSATITVLYCEGLLKQMITRLIIHKKYTLE